MVIDYKLTGRCNANCEFCWDFCKGISESKITDIIKVFEKLRGIVDIVSLTGGEPLVVKDVDTIIKLLSEMGFKIYLSTNGLLLNQHIEIVSKYVDILGVPIDSVNSHIQIEMGRDKEIIRMNLDNLVKIKYMNPAICTKVGSVATALNYKQIFEVGEIIFHLEKPVDSWRVYQFTEYGNARFFSCKYSIKNEIYNKLCVDLRERFGEKVSFLSSDDVRKSYWFITPDLLLANLSDTEYSVYGNLLLMESDQIAEILGNKEILENSLKNRLHLYHKEERE